MAGLLDAFNREYDTPTPGVAVPAERLARLLAGPSAVALLTGDPPLGVALLTMRPNVWYDGPVALLDELYIVPERRGRGLGTALLAAAEAAPAGAAASCWRSMSTATTWTRGASTSATGTPTASPARSSRCCTTSAS